MKVKTSIIFALVFIVPPFLYLIVNFYWWLFDGNVLQADKMTAAFFVTALGLLYVSVLQDAERKAK